MTKGVRIAILLPDLRGGGAEVVALVLAREFTAFGYCPEFVVMQTRGELAAEIKSQFPIIDLDCPRFRNLPRALARYLRTSRPDAVLASMWPITVLAVAAQKLSGHGCSVVLSEHNSLSFQYASRGLLHRIALRASMAIAYRFADARVGFSRGVTQDMAKLSGIAERKFDVINNPLRGAPEPTQQHLALAESFWTVPPGKRILTVGSLKLVKNHLLLIRAFGLLDDQNAQLMILGAGPEEGKLRALISDMGLNDQVVLPGFHSRPEAFYGSADLFVLSSDYEGFGNVIVEALATGTPVVSTNSPGPTEILGDGKWGTLVPAGNDRALSTAIANSLAAPADPDILRTRAADFVAPVAARSYLDLLRL